MVSTISPLFSTHDSPLTPARVSGRSHLESRKAPRNANPSPRPSPASSATTKRPSKSSWRRRSASVRCPARCADSDSRARSIVRVVSPFPLRTAFLGFFVWRSRLTENILPDLNAPVDVYSEWIDACETVAKEEADRELRLNAGQATAQDRDFSTYGTGDDRRTGAVVDGDGDEEINDDDY